MGKKVTMGTILGLDIENTYHDWILYDLAKAKKLPITRVKVNKKELTYLQYTKIIDRKEITILEGESKEILEHFAEIQRINRKKRVVVIPVKDKNVEKVLLKHFEQDVILFPSFKDYEERQKLVENILRRKEVLTQNEEVKRVLVRNMAKDVSTWENVFMLSEVNNYKQRVITENDIEELFPDNEFYSLNRFIWKTLEGKTKLKNIKMAHYFVEIREYSPRWVLEKIQETVHEFNLVYQAFRLGILLVPETPRALTERITSLGWKVGLELGDMPMYKQEMYLGLIDKIPYKYFVKILPIIYKEKRYVKPKDIYSLVEEIRVTRSEYNE